MPRRSIHPLLGIGALAACLTLTGCSGGSSGSEGLSRTVPLTSSQETNGNTSSASGTAEITVSPDRQRITVVLQTSGLSSVTAAHIHAGLAGTAGLMGQDAPIVFPLFDSGQGTFTGTIVKVLTAADFTAQPAAGINTFTDAVNAIVLGRAYVNVHTQANPSGEIRGQILPQSFTAQLNGANETPPTTGTGSGVATVAINPATCTFTVNGSTTSVAAGTVTGVQIHVGGAGLSGPMIFKVFDVAQGPYVGIFTKTLTETDLIAQPAAGINNCHDAINAVITGNAYIEVTTTVNPSGAIRGQLAPTENQ